MITSLVSRDRRSNLLNQAYMTQPSTTALLNRLLAIVCRSFPQYLRYSRPYIPAGREAILETLESIVTDQDIMAERIGQMIYQADELPRRGEFPMEFTDMHDLGIDFLINVAIEYQQQDIEAISELVGQLQFAPAAKSLAEETLGMAKAHLDSLKELIEPASASEL